MFPELRKVVTYDEIIYREGQRAADPPLRMIGVAAVVKNPWHGRGFVQDLSPEINRIAPLLGKMLTDMLVALAGSGEAIEAYGKASMAGTDAELEHGSALIHTLRFGNFYREAVGAKTYQINVTGDSVVAVGHQVAGQPVGRLIPQFTGMQSRPFSVPVAV